MTTNTVTTTITDISLAKLILCPANVRRTGGRLNRGQTVAEHNGEDLHHLAIAVGGSCQLATDPLQPRWKHPILEWRAVAQGARLARQHRNVKRWLAKFGHGYKWNTLPERGTFGVDQE